MQDESVGTAGGYFWRSKRGHQLNGRHTTTPTSNPPLERDVRGLADGVETAELGSHARAVVHSGRSPAERDTIGKVIMGQGHKGRAHFHARVITASSATLTAAAAPIPGRKYGESSRHDIWENGRGPKRHTGYEGMGPGAQAIEGQGSHNAAKHFGPHGLAGSPHDRHTRHSAAIYRVGS